MDNEVLELLKSISDSIKNMSEHIGEIEESQKRMENKLNAVYDQTADLTEFRTVVLESLEDIKENGKSINELLGEHEIALRTLRRKAI